MVYQKTQDILAISIIFCCKFMWKMSTNFQLHGKPNFCCNGNGGKFESICKRNFIFLSFLKSFIKKILFTQKQCRPQKNDILVYNNRFFCFIFRLFFYFFFLVHIKCSYSLAADNSVKKILLFGTFDLDIVAPKI